MAASNNHSSLLWKAKFKALYSFKEQDPWQTFKIILEYRSDSLKTVQLIEINFIDICGAK